MKISVLTPSFNSVAFIRRAIDSVLVQDYKMVEHIIVDGGSTDGTIQLLNEYSHLKWISEKDNGQSDAMNKAFDLATGDIIVYLNADDYFLENAFSEIINVFKSNANIDIVVGDLIIKTGNQYESHVPSIAVRDMIKYWDYKFPLNPVSYFYKRKVQTAICPFPIDHHYTMDYWFLLRAIKSFNVKKIGIQLGVFEMHLHNKSSSGNVLKSLQKEAFLFFHNPKNWSVFTPFFISFLSYQFKQVKKGNL